MRFNMRFILPYFRKYKLESVLAPLFKMLEACFDLTVPIIVASIINIGINNNDKHYIFTRFGLLVLMALCGLVCSFVAQYFAARAAIGTATDLRHRLLEKIQSFSFTDLDRLGASTLITRMTGDINQVQNGVNLFLRLFLRSPFIVFGAMIMAFTINSRIALVFVAAIAVLFVIVFGIMKLTSPMYKESQSKLDSVTGATREALNGVRVIRAFGREKAQNERFENDNSALYDSQIRVGKVAAFMNPLTYIVINAGIVLILWLGAGKVNAGLLYSGNVIALINYLSQILVELVKLANLVVQLSKSVAGAERIGAVLDSPCSIEYGNENEFDNTDEAVRFESVGMRYNGAGDNSLEDISFTAHRGEFIGIIGGTGSGKSTLVNLIPRFYDASEGEIYIFGKPIGSLSREALLKKVAVVDQNPRLFVGSVRDNMKWGKPDATDEEIWRALEAAQAAEFIKAKPGGLDEAVSQKGANFSGGQKQRLTIARALISNADILIFDDSTSALDYATDAALCAELLKLRTDKTIFMVSQRAGSLMRADKIIVLDDGKTVGIGTHERLLRTCPIYSEIYHVQYPENSDNAGM